MAKASQEYLKLDTAVCLPWLILFFPSHSLIEKKDQVAGKGKGGIEKEGGEKGNRKMRRKMDDTEGLKNYLVQPFLLKMHKLA